jgi:hypothetical protein
VQRRLTSSKSILENLLETQELQDGEVDGRVKSQTTLVGTEGGVELDTVTAVDLALALVIFPDDTELNNALGNGGDLESLLVLGVLLEEGAVLEGGDQLWKVVVVSAAHARFDDWIIRLAVVSHECDNGIDIPL